MPSAFISYRRLPSAMLANLIANELKKHGVDPYLDVRQADGGGPFPERLLRAIEKQDVFVCLIADITFDSDWVRREIEHAHTLGKLMIPVFQESYKSLTAYPTPHIEALLGYDGVHVFDVKNVLIDESIDSLARMIKQTPAASRQPVTSSRRFWVLSTAAIVLAIVLLLIASNVIKLTPTPEPTLDERSQAMTVVAQNQSAALEANKNVTFAAIMTSFVTETNVAVETQAAIDAVTVQAQAISTANAQAAIDSQATRIQATINAQAAANVPTDIPFPTPTSTPTPTLTPTPNIAATETADAAQMATARQNAQATQTVDAINNQLLATPLPVIDKGYQVGIQVQEALNYDPVIQDNYMQEVKNLGLGWFKQQVRWEDEEREKGNINWLKLDIVIPAAQRAKLKVMLSIGTAPAWARESGANQDKNGPPANNADYVNFVTRILQKYPGQVQAIEVWDEENIDREWASTKGLSAGNYVNLLKDTYTAVKAVDPGVIVISGALSPTGFNDGIGAWDDYVYLDQLIFAGLLNYTDCIGAHAYGYNISPSVPWDQIPNDPTAKFRGPFDNPHHSWSFYSTIHAYANKVALAGGQQKVCVTEFGWASTEDLDGYPSGFEFANDNTLEEQKTFTIQALDLMKEWEVVWLAFIWNLNYGPQAGWITDNHDVPYSIIGKDYVYRPVYDAIAEWSARGN